jgi:hypothetical protein
VTYPYRPKCKGLGWYEGPYYGDFEPKGLKLAGDLQIPSASEGMDRKRPREWSKKRPRPHDSVENLQHPHSA